MDRLPPQIGDVVLGLILVVTLGYSVYEIHSILSQETPTYTVTGDEHESRLVIRTQPQ